MDKYYISHDFNPCSRSKKAKPGVSTKDLGVKIKEADVAQLGRGLFGLFGD